MASEKSFDHPDVQKFLAQGCDITSLDGNVGQEESWEGEQCKKDKKCNTCPNYEDGQCDYMEEKAEWLEYLKRKVYDFHKKLGNECIDTNIYLENNGDIHSVANYAGNDTKAFSHNKDGYVNKEDYKKFLDYCKGDKSKLNEIKFGGDRKLTNPSCIYTIDSVGMPKESFWLPACPSIKSAAGAADLIEDYALALARDIPFYKWKNSKAIKYLAHYLSKLSDFWGPKKCGNVTWDCIFRGETKGDLKGHFVSQFLYCDVIQGAQKYDQKVYPYVPGKDYLTSYEDARKMQDGYNPATGTEALKEKRYITTLRDGASYIHNDYPGQVAQAIIQFLLSIKCPIKPQPKDSKEGYFIDLAITDIYDLVFRATKLAMCAAWHQKYTQLKLRPEAYGLLVEEAKRSGCNTHGLHKDLLESPILEKCKERWGSYCLPQCYSEGSPTHPSFPSGHATWVGAVVTILKAFFDTDFEFDAYGPNKDGSALVPLGYKVKVGDELDKVASNVGMFRNVGGIHYRSDMLGIYLGEEVAIDLLEEAADRYDYPVKFEFEKRNGEEVKIDNSKSCKKEDC